MIKMGSFIKFQQDTEQRKKDNSGNFVQTHQKYEFDRKKLFKVI